MVVFDMAGTTVNEDNIVYKTLLKAIKAAGFMNISLNQVLEQGAGKEKHQAIKNVLQAFAGINDEATTNIIYQNFVLQLSQAYAEEKIMPQANALQTFSELKRKGILRVFNTGYDIITAEKILTKLKWRQGNEFDLLVTASDVTRNRPYPDMIRYAMKQSGITDASRVIKIGDSIIDIEEGKNAGCALSIGITTGAHTHEQMQSANPDYILNDLSELLPILEK